MTSSGFSRPQVALTSAGVVCALGSGVETFWRALVAGECGFREVTLFDPSRYQAHAAAEVRRVPEDPAGEVEERAHLFALEAARQALAPLGGSLAGESSAVVAGTTLGGNRAWTEWLASGKSGLLPASSLPSAAQVLARRLGARGPVLTLSVACASGTAAIGAGAELIRTGRADRVLAGGYDALSEFVFSGFDALRALSPSSVRPFDRRRDGLGLGEGAAFVVLEEAGAASRRGAAPLALVAGYGSAADAHHMTRPSPSGEGLVRAACAALEDADLSPDAISFISSHGTGTTFNDRMEASAFARLFGPRSGEIPVNSIKSALGHTLGAAGALEAVMTALALSRGLLPPTVGYAERDPECPLDVFAEARALAATPRYALSTSSAFAGTNAALVLERA